MLPAWLLVGRLWEETGYWRLRSHSGGGRWLDPEGLDHSAWLVLWWTHKLMLFSGERGLAGANRSLGTCSERYSLSMVCRWLADGLPMTSGHGGEQPSALLLLFMVTHGNHMTLDGYLCNVTPKTIPSLRSWTGAFSYSSRELTGFCTSWEESACTLAFCNIVSAPVEAYIILIWKGMCCLPWNCLLKFEIKL